MKISTSELASQLRVVTELMRRLLEKVVSAGLDLRTHAPPVTRKPKNNLRHLFHDISLCDLPV